MSEILQDIDGVEVLVDDILVSAETEEQHNRVLKEVMSRSRKHNHNALKATLLKTGEDGTNILKYL